MAMEAYEVLEAIEAAITGLTPRLTTGEYDRFVVVDVPDPETATVRAADRTVVVGDLYPPVRTRSSGGCQLAQMTAQVVIIYGTGIESRRRRLSDAWQVTEAIRHVRQTHADIRACTPTPGPTTASPDGTDIFATWNVEVEYLTTPISFGS